MTSLRTVSLLCVLIAALLMPVDAIAKEPCTAANYLTGCATSTSSDFRGAIIVPGSEVANREVARTHGCDGCDWTLVLDCDRNAVDSPSYVNCNASRCPDGTAYRIYLQRPTDANPAYLDTICLTPRRRIVTPADLAIDMARYLTRVAPPASTIAVQPEGRAVVGLATYFIARGPGHDEATLDVVTAAGPARLRLDIAPRRYTWTFGDGAACETTSPGGTYDGGDPVERCDSRVAHVYAAPGLPSVALRTAWGGTYTFDVGYGAVGPLPIPGAGVPGPPAERTVRVREARAELIGG